MREFVFCKEVSLMVMTGIVLMLSIGLATVGIVMHFYLGLIVKKLLYIHTIPNDVQIILKAAGVPGNDSSLSNSTGLALLIISFILIWINVIGFCASGCNNKQVLKLFCTMNCVMVAVEIIICLQFLPPLNSICQNAKDKLLTALRRDYQVQGDNPLSVAMNNVMSKGRCCGYSGPQDFRQMTLNYEYKNKFLTLNVPLACCNHTRLEFHADDVITCAISQDSSRIGQNGCLTPMFEALYQWEISPVIIISFIIALQIVQMFMTSILIHQG